MTSRALVITLVAAAALASIPLSAAAAPTPPTHTGRGAAAHPKTIAAPVLADVANAGFEAGDLSGWQFHAGSTDVAIVPKNPPDACFQPDMPSEGNFMACLSTGTFFGAASNGGVRSDLTSDAITFSFRPDTIKITFDVDFQSEEPVQSIGHNDAFEARLVTLAGSFPIVQIDTFGRTTPGRGLRVEGFNDLQGTQPGCGIVGIRTGRLRVTWTKPLDPVLRATISRGPVFVEFSISNQGDAQDTSIACVDDVQVRVTKPSSN